MEKWKAVKGKKVKPAAFLTRILLTSPVCYSEGRWWSFVKFQLFPSKFCNLFYRSHPWIDPFFIGNPKIQFLLARVHMKKKCRCNHNRFLKQCCAQSSVYQNKVLVYYSWLISFLKSTSFWKSEDCTNT